VGKKKARTLDSVSVLDDQSTWNTTVALPWSYLFERCAAHLSGLRLLFGFALVRMSGDIHWMGPNFKLLWMFCSYFWGFARQYPQYVKSLKQHIHMPRRRQLLYPSLNSLLLLWSAILTWRTCRHTLGGSAIFV
jgi:hypothetical protein